ncbi:hypothetical protein AVEN_88409-1 [Araneus ventricosus]|uniref:Uncharacterized protein n=1 Tax=Araneus ventricosus TaxID=182803 RepID=A0A4Y2PQ58_ARAVE|nr:hypothetical protein AVEN_88409-1 [Araneus ventricosus]
MRKQDEAEKCPMPTTFRQREESKKMKAVFIPVIIITVDRFPLINDDGSCGFFLSPTINQRFLARRLLRCRSQWGGKISSKTVNMDSDRYRTPSMNIASSVPVRIAILDASFSLLFSATVIDS